MTIFTWTGGAYSYDWEDKDNWDQKKVPGAKDDVIVATAQTSYDKPKPSDGATVRRLNLHGGGLQGQLTVKKEVVWTNGHLDQGLDVKGEAEVVISGFALKMLGGPLRLPRGRIEGASIGLYNGATVTVDGQVECSGESLLTWTSSRPATFQVAGKEGVVLSIKSGTLRVDTGMFRGEGVVDISAGATLALEGHEQFHVLAGDCRASLATTMSAN